MGVWRRNELPVRVVSTGKVNARRSERRNEPSCRDGWAGLVGSSVRLRLLAAARAVRGKVESLMRSAAVRAMLGSREIQPSARGSFSTAHRDDVAGGLDCVAGSEFLDDRIRLRE